MTNLSRGFGAVILGLATAQCLGAQSLDRRIAAAPDGPVQFHFAAREGVCGNGKGFLRADESGYYTSFSDGSGRDLCAAGPVRVVAVRVGKEIVKLETFAGPLTSGPDDGADLGVVSGREAAAYLLSLAGILDGRPARDAILPAMLADSAQVTTTLLALMRDQTRPRELRRSALTWLSRRRDEPGGVGTGAVDRALDQLVRDRSESESIRSAALSTISSRDRGEGVPTLIAYANGTDGWLARQSFASLSRSGDPRARQFTRAALRRTDLSDESRVAAIQGIGGDQATGADIAMLRELYPSLNSDRERDAVLSVVANAGGSANTEWLLTVATSATEPAQRRRRAVSLLGRSDDPRVAAALKGLVER
ncbi:MAG: HEAT repeat domain-containing protein [Gemmatimonadota bacterium]